VKDRSHGISNRDPVHASQGISLRAGDAAPGRPNAPGNSRRRDSANEGSRVQQNPAYLTVILLSRVVTKLGSLADVHPGVIEGLYASDLSYLQALYQDLNGDGAFTTSAVCPKCEHRFDVRFDDLGEA
jgi:hypothetical protein